MMTGDNAYPTATVANLGARIGGWLVDSFVAFVLAIPVIAAFGIFDTDPTRVISMMDLLTIFAYTFVAFTLSQGYFLATSGQTLGKKAMGTRIVNFENGELVSLPKLLFVRYLPMLLMTVISFFQIIDVAFIFGERRQCLHDKIAGTHVVNV